MSYTDINTPVIEKIKLPSGTEYYVADRELREVVSGIGEVIAGGVSFIIAWDGTSAPTIANVPAGVVISYNSTSYTGTLSADSAQAGAFYLIKSSTSPTNETLDIYDEYISVGVSGSKTWEKIGDTQINLTDIVKNVNLNKFEDTVIGADSTFTITQPTITLTENSESDLDRITYVKSITSSSKYLTSSTSVNSGSNDVVNSVVKIDTSATPSNTDLLKGISVTNGVLTFGAVSYSTDSVLGADTTFSATTTHSLGDSNNTGSAQVLTAVSSTLKYLSASASGANTAWNNKDSTTVLTNATSIGVTKGSV